MMNEDICFGIVIGIFIGLFSWIFLIGFIISPVNIDYEDGYQTIDVIKITKYSDGMQIIETTAYTQLFGYRFSDNYTYTDPKNLVLELGSHKIKSSGAIRTIDSVISIVGVVS